jgi:translation elongation factor EF-1alpha
MSTRQSRPSRLEIRTSRHLLRHKPTNYTRCFRKYKSLGPFMHEGSAHTVLIQVELFHQSREIPAMFSKLLYTCDRATGAVLKTKPRFISKNTAAVVEITLRSNSHSLVAKPSVIPIETFSMNKLMGRVVLRRGGETIGAGTSVLTP